MATASQTKAKESREAAPTRNRKPADASTQEAPREAQNGKPREPAAQDPAAALQQRVRLFTDLYEREAWRVYNLALRITCRRAAAIAAAEEAFLSQVEAPEPGATLVPVVVARARDHTKAKPSPNGAGDDEAQRLLAAAAELPPTERAALALASIVDPGARGVGAGMGLPLDKAAQLLERADEGLASALRASAGNARASRSTWPWAEPPPELWQSLYPKLHRALEQQARGGKVPAVAAAAPQRWFRRRRFRVAAGALLIAAAAAFLILRPYAGEPTSAEQAVLGGGVPGVDATGGGGDGEGSSYEALTPEELDELRRKELRDLREYGRQQQDQSLSPAQRGRAAQQAQQLAQRAQARMRAAQRREAAAARQQREAARRAQQLRQSSGGGGGGSTTTSPSRTDSGSGSGSGGGGSGGGSGGGGSKQQQQQGGKKKNPDRNDGSKTQEQVKQECLFNQDTGTYICPN